MKKYYSFIALAALALASCTSDEFVGENNPTQKGTEGGGIISFVSSGQGRTRGDITGDAAATLLGNHFYVTGTKGTEQDANPTENLVFDNYLVAFSTNTAGTTESNTANWEYVGITPGTDPYGDYAKLSSVNSQTIKYWDYSTEQYDFLAFSTGSFKAVDGTSGADDEIGVTAMKYGADLANSAIAYSFDIPSVAALSNVFISDITEVTKANYGNEVTLKFKNLGSKVRIALYETVPGYAVKDVVFYTIDGTNDFTDADKSSTATLISANEAGLPVKGKIDVYFPHVGTDNESAADYDKATATVTAASTGGSKKFQLYGALSNFAKTREGDEADGDYIGRTLPTATFAGVEAADYYTTVFPVSSSDPLTLRVDYTLVSTDGSGEVINVYGAKAVVPSTYTQWLPNYAYTYIFKISDNTNGWTSPDASTDDTDAGLFPITFDAVVAEATDATGEQTTITTVAAPTITTYQQGHEYSTNEYKKGDKNLYVQVMDNSAVPATLVTTLSDDNSVLYAISDADATEADVMNALENRTTGIDVADVIGRNSITLTKNANISNDVTSIVNGVDDNPIIVASGSAAEITINSLVAGSYAYVYDYTSDDKKTVTEYQPIDVSGGTVGESGKSYYFITIATLKDIDDVTSDGEAVDNNYVYFSKTTNGGSTTKYSYFSVAGKTTLPAGLIKLAKNVIVNTIAGGSSADSTRIYFDKYITNNGKYAVKVIKVVE
jgi:hypothetical protein